MSDGGATELMRYHRQVTFAGLGAEGQRRLLGARVLIVGAGGLGTWTAELLARAGVGGIRLVDPDRVELANLHRQGLYDESAAARGRLKVEAAAERLRRINAGVRVEPVATRADAGNIARLADGAHVILDGTDNFATRFVLNDYAVKANLPWVFAGVVAAEGQVMAVVPGRTPCLRCVYDEPPPPRAETTCRAAGVLGPAVAAISAIQTMEAVKILAGSADAVSPYLMKLDFWANTLQRVDVARACATTDCECCKKRHFEYLEG